ncbi:TorF family putative porin [Kaarinaea lacus]
MNLKRHVTYAILLLSSLSVFPVVAAEQDGASLSGNLSAVSTYVWRGLLRSDAALQGGVDYDSGAGIHAGIWTSNVYIGSEMDVTVGYAGTVKDFGFDVGLTIYNFPQYEESFTGDYNFNELYVSLSKDFLNARFSTSADAGNYIEINALFDKVFSNWDLGLHFGTYDIDDDFEGNLLAGADENYNDYSASLNTKVDGFNLSFILSDTSIDHDTYRTIIKVSKSFKP